MEAKNKRGSFLTQSCRRALPPLEIIKEASGFFVPFQSSFPDQQRIFVPFLFINVPILSNDITILPNNGSYFAQNVFN